MFTMRGIGRRENLERSVRCAAGVLLQAALRLEQVRALRPQGCPGAAEVADSFGCCGRTGSCLAHASQHEGAGCALLSVRTCNQLLCCGILARVYGCTVAFIQGAAC